mgnify:CR=1 FL=1
MKKINITPKAKKSLIITGAAVICIGISAFALSAYAGAPAAEPQSAAASSASPTSLTISIAPIEDTSEIGSQAPTFVPSSGASQSAQLTKIQKPTSTPPKPVVEGDASTASNGTKTQPTNSALTNKNTKPSYTSKPTAPTTKPSSKPSSSSKPSGGKPGQVYDPVFGWTNPTGGEGTTVGKPGDELTGDKVGIMD